MSVLHYIKLIYPNTVIYISLKSRGGGVTIINDDNLDITQKVPNTNIPYGATKNKSIQLNLLIIIFRPPVMCLLRQIHSHLHISLVHTQ